MAGFAVRAELALMKSGLGMAGHTILGRPFKDIIDMTLVTGQILMGSSEWKGC